FDKFRQGSLACRLDYCVDRRKQEEDREDDPYLPGSQKDEWRCDQHRCTKQLKDDNQWRSLHTIWQRTRGAADKNRCDGFDYVSSGDRSWIPGNRVDADEAGYRRHRIAQAGDRRAQQKTCKTRSAPEQPKHTTLRKGGRLRRRRHRQKRRRMQLPQRIDYDRVVPGSGTSGDVLVSLDYRHLSRPVYPRGRLGVE